MVEPTALIEFPMRRIVFLQHGDYAEAAEIFAVGGDETHGFQKWSVDVVASLAGPGREVWVICVTQDYPARPLPNGVWARGVHRGRPGGSAALMACLDDIDPTDVILRFPSQRLLEWCRARFPGIRTLPLFADSFQDRAMSRFRSLGQLRSRRLANLLNDPAFPIVGNHNLAAARSLESIGVSADKIVPWDRPALVAPSSYAVKRRKPGPFRLAYVGSLSIAKGVMDVIRALHAVQATPEELVLSVVGSGEASGECLKLVEALGLQDSVEFLGKMAHSRVLELFRTCDAAVVPSWPEYPEGLPKTITEALSMRTPVILSDHPVFAQSFSEDCGVLFFPAKDHLSLASVISRLMKDEALYQALSETTAQAWGAIQCPVTWDDVLSRWLRNEYADVEWLNERTLASTRMDNAAT